MSRCGRRCATGFRRTADDNRPDPAAIENAGGLSRPPAPPSRRRRVVQSTWRAQKLAAQNTLPMQPPTCGHGKLSGRKPKGNEAVSVARMARRGGLCRTAVVPHPLCHSGTSQRPAMRAWYLSAVRDFSRDITMIAKAAHSKTKRLPSPQRKPIQAAKLAQRLAEVQALRKLVQKAEASRAY